MTVIDLRAPGYFDASKQEEKPLCGTQKLLVQVCWNAYRPQKVGARVTPQRRNPLKEWPDPKKVEKQRYALRELLEWRE